jgi:hypothetical protein
MKTVPTPSPRRSSLAARFSALMAIAMLAMVVPTLATTITVNVGRPSRSCTGFGICSITIDFAGTARSVPANAVIEGNRMMMQFAQTPPDKNEVLVVEEDVVLDAATSLRLGYKQVTVKKGTYTVNYNGNPNGTVGVDVQTSGIVIKVKLGRASQNCTGFGICEISVNWLTAEHVVQGVAALNGDMLDLDLLGTTSDKGDLLMIDEDITLDAETARAFGAQQVVIRKGQYHVDYTKNPNGHVELPVSRIGIYVEITVGRRSKGCEGFGICDITVGLDFSVRAVGSSASIDGNVMTIDFLKNLPEQGNVLTIDEDIVLNDATSLALGYQHVVVKKGEYQVDYSSNPNGRVRVTVQVEGASITIKIGHPSNGCNHGFGICIIFDPWLSTSTERTVGGSASVKGDIFSLDFLGIAPDRGDVLTLEDDVVLDDATARRFGYQHLTLRKGQYNVDYTKNPNGHVEIPVMRYGVTIHVEAGRRSKGCTGFGICSITIGFDFSERTVGSSASIDGNMMTIDFLKNLPEQGNVLTIDEDIVLDDATSLALGYQHVVVKKGEYQVDYSNNPNGRVTVQVQTMGIGVTIKVARMTSSCVRGFGICIIIDTWLSTSSDRDVRGSISVNGDMLSLDFLGTAPEHGDLLTLEEDVVLDDATAHRLGYQHLTLRKGEYRVDYTKNPNGHVEIPVAKIGIGITITLGRASRDCDGGGICKVRIGLELGRMNDAPGVGSVKGDKLVMDLLKQNGTHYDMLLIDQDIVLDSATSRALGYDQVTIRKGAYAVDYSSNPNGHVEVDIEARGIVITIYVGRRSQGCTGFGICGIVIEASAERNALRAVATYEDGKMRVKFLEQPQMHGDTLTIDEDITLSEEIAKALGLPSNVVRKGDYPVDYSDSPYGTFRLETPSENTASVTSLNSTTSEALALTVAPNPTLGKAMFSFSLPQSAHVTVTLTDARGTQVATLMNDEPRSAGRHSISFDGSSLPAGTYFYTVHAGSMTGTYRMQIVR